jgi:hypothetical protein
MIVPMPMYSHGGGGDLSASLVIIVLLSVIYFMQIVWAIIKLFSDEYEDKKEFFIDLIPFIPYIVKLVKKIVEL